MLPQVSHSKLKITITESCGNTEKGSVGRLNIQEKDLRKHQAQAGEIAQW